MLGAVTTACREQKKQSSCLFFLPGTTLNNILSVTQNGFGLDLQTQKAAGDIYAVPSSINGKNYLKTTLSPLPWRRWHLLAPRHWAEPHAETCFFLRKKQFQSLTSLSENVNLHCKKLHPYLI